MEFKTLIVFVVILGIVGIIYKLIMNKIDKWEV
jgi:predicted membrane channel-forming protein YqfA (hemolysin III family)